MSLGLLPDAEDLAKAWLLTTGTAELVSDKVFMAVPKGDPLPCIVLRRVGGAPSRSHVPQDAPRISFDVWAANRPAAKSILRDLVDDLLDLDSVQYTSVEVGGRIGAVEVVSSLWLPDPVSDRPRYIVDAVLQILPL